MLPKVEAAAAFAKKSRVGIITNIENLKTALAGHAGTIVKS
jgi:carbamate kinase